MDKLLYRVLLVEDNEDDYLIVRDLLTDIGTPEFDITWVDNYQAARASLLNGHYDVCLLDYRLGEATGVELVREFGAGETPFILLTGQEEHEVDITVSEAGASDYLIKGHINAPLLERSIRYAIKNKKTASELQHSQRFAQATVDALPSMVCVLDENGTIVTVNAAWREFAQTNGFVEVNSGIGANYLKVCDAAQTAEATTAAAGIRAVIAGQEQISILEYPCHAPEELRWFQMTATCFKSEGPVRVVVTHSNITDRKLAEAQIKQHSHLLNVIGQAVIVTDRSGVITYWNQSAETLYGWSSAEVLGRNVLEVTPTNSTQQEAAEIMASLVKGRNWSGEFLVQRRDGTLFPTHVTNTPVFDESGELISIIGLSFDITERKKAEEKLRRSEERYRAFITATSEAIWRFELETPIPLSLSEDQQIEQFYHHAYLAECNDAMARMYCFDKAQEIVSTRLGELMPPSDLSSIEFLRAFIRSGYNLHNFESREVDRHGQTKIFLNNLVGITENDALQRVWGTQRDITERRAAQEKLQQSEASLARAQKIARLGSWELELLDVPDFDQNPLHWSDEVFRIFGYRPGEIEVSNQNFFNAVHPEDRERIRSGVSRALNEGGIHSLDHRIILPDGTERLVHEHWEIVCEKGAKKPTKIVGTIQDVTERKQAEEALRESQQRLTLATQSAHIGIWDFNAVTNELIWDAQMREMYGIQEQDFGGAYYTWQKGLHPEDQERAEEELKDALEGKSDFNTSFRVVWPNGEVKCLEAHALVLRDSDGSPLRMIGVNRDVTRARQNEAALRQSQERFELMSRATNDVVWDWNLLTDKIWWNESFESRFGYDREKIESDITSWTTRVHPDDFVKAVDSVTALITEGKQFWSGEYRFQRADGSYAHVFDRGFVIHDENQRAVRMIGSMQDISERKEAENQLRASEERFQSIVSNVPGTVYQFVSHPDGSIEIPFVNEGCRELFEIEPEELQRHPTRVLECIHPDDQAVSDRLRQESAATLQPWKWEGRLKLPSGKIKWVEGASRPQRLPSGGTLWNGLLMDITARTEAENQRDRFFSLSPDMMAIADFDGYFKRINPAFSETLGYTEAELLAQPFLEFTHPEDQAATLETIDRLAEGTVISCFENRYLKKDGSWCWLEWRSIAVVEEGLIYAVAHDVTNRKAAEATLLRMRDELELRVIERTRDLEEANATLHKEIAERERAERGARTQARQQESVAALGNRALEGADLQTLFDGAVSLIASTLQLDVGRVLEFLPEQEAFLVRSAVGLPAREIGRAVIDGRENSKSMAGHVLRSGETVVVSDFLTTTRFIPDRVFMESGVVSVINLPIGSNDQPYGVLCGGSKQVRVFTQDDIHFLQAVVNVLSAAVTRVRTDEEIRLLNGQLQAANEELRVENIEHEMTMHVLRSTAESLEQATREANSANQAKSDFLSRMSHELRTPLNAILGFGQILEMKSDEEENPQEYDNIQQILRGGRHLLDLINEVLDVARIEAGHLSLSPEPIHVDNAVRETLDLVLPLALSRQIDLVNEIVDVKAIQYVLADQQRFKQVLINLFSNAIKYNREGGSVFISSEVRDSTLKATTHNWQNGNHTSKSLRILVRDTGAGLPPQDISKLFTPFERLEAARSQIEGTGIGLTLCKRLVEAMNGQIGVESVVGQGSTFWIELPLVGSVLESEKQFALLEEEAILLPNQIRGTILCIEDNLDNLKFIERALAMKNFNIRLLRAMQGSIGLELAAQHIPDVILLDINLPDIMGDAVLRQLKAQPATRDIPIVVLSADATPGQVARLLAAGATAYLTKPIDLRQLYETLEQVLQRNE